MDKLPPETIAHIFSFLTYEDRIRVASVCNKWYKLNNSLRCWHIEERVVVKKRNAAESFAGFLKHHGFRIRRVTLSHPLGIKEFRVAVVSCPNVEIATIELADFARKNADNGLGFVARFWTNLTRLTLASNRNNESGLQRVFGNCRHLRYLCLRGDRYLKSIRYPHPLPCLRELKLSRLSELCHLSLDCPNLETLTLHLCWELSNVDELLRSSGKSLLKFKVRSCYGLYSAGFESGIRCCVNLTHVSLNYCTASNQALEILSVACKNTLRTLKLLDTCPVHTHSFLPLLRCARLSELHFSLNTKDWHQTSIVVENLIDFLISHPTISIVHVETSATIQYGEVMRLLSSGSKELSFLDMGRVNAYHPTDLDRQIREVGYNAEWYTREARYSGETTTMLRCKRI